MASQWVSKLQKVDVDVGVFFCVCEFVDCDHLVFQIFFLFIFCFCFFIPS